MPDAQRPDGPVLWCHVAEAQSLQAANALLERLREDAPAVTTVLTSPLVTRETRRGRDVQLPPPVDSPWAAESFLRHWAPNLCLWLGGFETTLLTEMERRAVPAILANISEADLPPMRSPWSLMKARMRLRLFSRILATTPAAASRLLSLGAEPSCVSTIGSLRAHPLPPRYDEAERDYLTEILEARPIWYANVVPEAEVSMVIAAHEAAIGRAHRSLAIVNGATEAAEEALFEQAKAAGLQVARRSETDEIDRDVQWLLADLPDEEGLWYRLAPQSYMGGTVAGHPAAQSPMSAAALGSAVIHGHAYGAHASDYTQLVAAGATEVIPLNGALAKSLNRVSAPERSAALAHAAWDIATRGADVTDRIISELMAGLETGEVAG